MRIIFDDDREVEREGIARYRKLEKKSSVCVYSGMRRQSTYHYNFTTKTSGSIEPEVWVLILCI